MKDNDFNERSWKGEGQSTVLPLSMTSLFYAKSTFQYIVLQKEEYAQTLVHKDIETATVNYLQTLWSVYSYQDAIIKIDYIRSSVNHMEHDEILLGKKDTSTLHTNNLNHAAILFLRAVKAQNQRITQPKLILSGTALQIATWKALEMIPYGKVVSYSDIATLIKRPKAVRAVANAISNNPLAPILPCHRVIRSNGEIGGYAFGKAEKEKILRIEISESKRQY